MEQTTLDHIARAKLVPVLRAATVGAAVQTAEGLLANGLTVIELTATTPGWQDALARLRSDHPNATLGMGTIDTEDNAKAAIDGGAQFLVSPWPAPPVREVAAAREIPFLEGGFTPAELAAATSRGVAKLFPAHLGGVTYLKSLLAVLPGARIMPTGGIKLDDVGQWIAAGAFAVGVGSELAGVSAARVREVLDAI